MPTRSRRSSRIPATLMGRPHGRLVASLMASAIVVAVMAVAQPDVLLANAGEPTPASVEALGAEAPPALNSFPFALAFSGTDLYAGGRFTDAAGIPEADYLARWDGFAWSPVGSGSDGRPVLNEWVQALLVVGSDIYVGGRFTDAAGIPEADYVARWDGSTWSALGSDGSGDGALDGPVEALATDGTRIYVGGRFDDAGGAPAADRIAAWDGNAWSSLGGGSSGDGVITGTGHVLAIAVMGQDVYVGGRFLQLNEISEANDIARWDGGRWIALGSDGAGGAALNREVTALAVRGTDLYVAGGFTDAGGLAGGDRVAMWDGTSWTALGAGYPGSGIVSALALIDDDLHVGGTSGVETWDGSAWSSIGPTPYPVRGITALAVQGSDLYVAGNYGHDRIGRWDGGSWFELVAGGAGAGAAGGVEVRPFRNSVPTPSEITLDPVTVAQAALITGSVVLFIPFPGGLFNSTLDANYDEVLSWARAGRRRLRGWLGAILAAVRRQARPSGPASDVPITASAAGDERPVETPSRLWQSPRGIALFTLVSALLVSLLDPTFGLDGLSVATFLGATIGLVVTLVAFMLPQISACLRSGTPFFVRALPGTLAIGIACVAISRVSGFQPGYLYGLIVGLVAARDLGTAVEGRTSAVTVVTMLAVAAAAWVCLGLIAGAAVSGTDPSFGQALAETALVTVVVAGFEGAAIGMAPIRFLPGEKVKTWNRRLWAVLFGVAVFSFVFILINPSSGYLADSSRTPLLTIAILLAFFGVGSILFWAYFRFRRPRKPASVVA